MPGRIDFEEFLAAIRSLWGRTRMSDDEIRHTGWIRIEGQRADDVVVALKRHRVDEPDAASPNWKAVWRILRKMRGVGTTTTNELQVHLGHVRNVARDVGWKGVENWSDADTYARYVEANTRPITHAPNGEPYADEDSRRAMQAAKYRKTEARIWRQRLSEAELPIPSFLDE